MFFADLSPAKSLSDRLRELGDRTIEPPKLRQRRDRLTELLAAVSDPALAVIRRRDADLIARDIPQGWFKYLDCAYFIDHNLDVAEHLGLIGSPPMTILDIGAGAGHFAFVCAKFGHDVTAIDVEAALLDEIAAAMGVRRTVARVEPDTRLPDFGRKFDLVVAESTMFNMIGWTWRGPLEHNLRMPPYVPYRYWTLAQWRFLLADLIDNQLRFPGRIYFHLNCEIRDGAYRRNTELLTFCADRGAVVRDQGGGLIDWRLTRPVRLAAV
ncbi:MAG: class I SAM-dependent methyltransferase [Stellaceae bacterium]